MILQLLKYLLRETPKFLLMSLLVFILIVVMASMLLEVKSFADTVNTQNWIAAAVQASFSTVYTGQLLADAISGENHRQLAVAWSALSSALSMLNQCINSLLGSPFSTAVFHVGMSLFTLFQTVFLCGFIWSLARRGIYAFLDAVSVFTECIYVAWLFLLRFHMRLVAIQVPDRSPAQVEGAVTMDTSSPPQAVTAGRSTLQPVSARVRANNRTTAVYRNDPGHRSTSNSNPGARRGTAASTASNASTVTDATTNTENLHMILTRYTFHDNGADNSFSHVYLPNIPERSESSASSQSINPATALGARSSTSSFAQSPRQNAATLPQPRTQSVVSASTNASMFSTRAQRGHDHADQDVNGTE